MPDGDKVKILLIEGDEAETVWAERVGSDTYRLENSPFWKYGVSWKDTVVAHPDAAGRLEMVGIAQKGGHRTVRVFFEGPFADQDEMEAILSAVNALGATYEGMNRVYVSIDLPPQVSLLAVATLLTRAGVNWEYADPPYEAVALDDRPVPS